MDDVCKCHGVRRSLNRRCRVAKREYDQRRQAHRNRLRVFAPDGVRGNGSFLGYAENDQAAARARETVAMLQRPLLAKQRAERGTTT